MIKYVDIAGFKSISSSQRLDFSGLTLLAGSNSSGKSAVMQPILLLKQTIDSSYDPGAILLDGPNARITTSEQILSKIKSKNRELIGAFSLTIGAKNSETKIVYRKAKSGAFKIDHQVVSTYGSESIRLAEGALISSDQLERLSTGKAPLIPTEIIEGIKGSKFSFKVVRERCFLRVGPFTRDPDGDLHSIGLSFDVTGGAFGAIKRMIHVPGLRGNPERNYRATEISSQFPGTYENYVASIIKMWQESADKRLSTLGDQLKSLGLTWKVMARKVDDTRVELRVGRMPQASRGGASDLVSLADVGLGVAQILPILVALLSAVRNQVVYIEQPELHLHPKAQWKLSEIFSDAINRGVRVVVETHSAILLRGIQTEIARGRVKGSDVRLNWFTRDIDGNTNISTCTPGKDGSFGDWPADFDDTSLSADGAYLDAVMGPLDGDEVRE